MEHEKRSGVRLPSPIGPATPPSPMRIGFVGAGRVASILARGLAEAGHQVAAIGSRRHESAVRLAARIPGCLAAETAQQVTDACDLTFLTVPDDSIEDVAGALRWRPGCNVVHCSGALSLGVLAAAERSGAGTGSFHPLQTFAEPDPSPEALAGCAIAIEGTPPLVETLEGMAQSLGGKPLRLPAGCKPLYHASATLASNYVVTLLALAAELWESFGVDRSDALAALIPLLRGTVANLEQQGVPGALTGPISRGDVGTVRRQLEALQARAPGIMALYCQLATRTIPLARAKGGLDESRERELRQLLAEQCQPSKGQKCA